MDVKGIYDVHVHTAPDVSKRKFTDPELAARLEEKGMAGFLVKNHFTETAARAALLQAQFPKLKIIGGIVLKRTVGGFNPYAVENCAKLGGRVVWLPTLEARSYQKKKHPGMSDQEAAAYLTALDDNGQLVPGISEILDIVKAYDMVLATGHVSAEEGLAVLKAAHDKDIQKLVATHVDGAADYYTTEQLKQAAALGAMTEHCYFNIQAGHITPAEMAERIRAVGAEQVVLSTDVGQPASPYPDEALSKLGDLLLAEGITPEELHIMLVDNPARYYTRAL